MRSKARVEGCIAEAFAAKEITNFTSMYFSRAHNINAPTMRCHIVEEKSLTTLKVFDWKGKGVGASTAHFIMSKEWDYTLLYLYTNMEEVVKKYFKNFR